MSINHLYISHAEYNFSNQTTLLDNRNLKEAINSKQSLDYHTSISDIGYENLQLIIELAKEITLVKIDIFHNDIPDHDYYVYGRLINELFKHKNKVNNFDWIKNFNWQFFNQTLTKPQTNSNTLWTIGCSITEGMGVDHEERYGYRLSNLLGRPEVSLSKGGSSVVWAADQILRSDVKSGDIVVWGLTNICRIDMSHEWNWFCVAINGYDLLPKKLQYHTLDYFDSQTKFLLTIKHILQVKNFCEKIGAKLILANLMDTTYLNCVFDNLPNYVDLCRQNKYTNELEFLDLGTDNQHPGPKQHEYYANRIYNLIKENNYGN